MARRDTEDTQPGSGGKTMIRAEHYEQSTLRLMDDPIIKEMANEIHLRGGERYTNGEGFLFSALSEYRRRGGVLDCHIGGPSEAIIRILDYDHSTDDKS